MRRHRVHLPQLESGEQVVIGNEALHLAQVLRVGPGSEVRAFDGKGHEALGVVLEAHPHRVVIELQEPEEIGTEARLAVKVAFALLKGDKLADVVRQCTELGAAAFQPLLTARADVPHLSANKLERLRRVAREAAKQSGRAVVPPVHEALPLAGFEPGGVTIIADPTAAGTLAQLQLEGTDPITILTGPEGGFTPEEVATFTGRGASAVRLGSRVLRAQTAPVAILSALLLPEAL